MEFYVTVGKKLKLAKIVTKSFLLDITVVLDLI